MNIGRSNCRFWYELFMIRSPRLASEASEVEQIIPDLWSWILLMQGSAHYHHRRITRFGIRSIRSISQEGDNPRFVLDPNKGRGIPSSSIQDPLWIAQNRDNTLLCGFWQIKVITKFRVCRSLQIISYEVSVARRPREVLSIPNLIRAVVSTWGTTVLNASNRRFCSHINTLIIYPL